MVESETLSSLEDVVAQLSIKLRYEKGDFQGGYCRIGNTKMLIINAGFDLQRKVSLISKELSKFDLSETFMVPAIRLLIEKNRTDHPQPEV